MIVQRYAAIDVAKTNWRGEIIRIRDKHYEIMGTLESAEEDGDRICFRISMGERERVSVVWTRPEAHVFISHRQIFDGITYA